MKGLERVNWKVAVLLICLISLPFFNQVPICVNLQTKEESSPSKSHSISYISHEPFNITSNTDFETQGWPGNGSLIDPYLIENLNITTSSSACIWIMNTTSHFIIQNCLFSSPIYDYMGHYLVFPITLANVSNGKFCCNQVLNSYGGVSGYKLSNCNISHNSFNASNTVINVYHSNFTSIHNNTQNFDHCSVGMNLVSCRNSVVSSNSFKIVRWSGISSVLAYNISYVDNTIIALETDVFMPINGIELLSGSNCTLRANEIVGFWWSGIELRGDCHLVEYNNITSNLKGILISSNGSMVRHNTFTNNSNSIEIVNSNDTDVYSNEICSYSSYSAGIVIHGGTDCDIYLNEIQRIGYGIALQGATGFNISNNIVGDGRYGFVFSWYGTNYPSDVADGPSYNCDIIDNIFDKGGVFPAVDNYANWNFSSIRFFNNTVNGRPIGFFTQLDGSVLHGEGYGQVILICCKDVILTGGDYYGIISDRYRNEFHDPGMATAIVLIGCHGCEIGDVSFHNNTIGINVQYSTDILLLSLLGYDNSWAASITWHSETIVLSGCYFRNNLKGIASGWSVDIRIYNGLIWENGEGIVLVNNPNSIILNVDIYENEDAIFLGDSDMCTIRGNSICWNTRGILLNSSSDCLITKNEVCNNTRVGICVDLTSRWNEIYDNIFTFNNPNAICSGTSNHWDNQVDTGNWWSDWSGEGPYIIDEDDQDNFPMMNITTTSPTTKVELFTLDPLILGIAGGVIGIVVLVILLIDRRRVHIID